MMLMCATCAYWSGNEHSFAGGCAKGVYTGSVAFDRAEPPCPEHSTLACAAPKVAPPMVVQMFVPGVGVGKP